MDNIIYFPEPDKLGFTFEDIKSSPKNKKEEFIQILAQRVIEHSNQVKQIIMLENSQIIGEG